MRDYGDMMCNYAEYVTLLDDKKQLESARKSAFPARYPGRCVLTGERFQQGALIYRFGGGWALAKGLE